MQSILRYSGAVVLGLTVALSAHATFQNQASGRTDLLGFPTPPPCTTAVSPSPVHCSSGGVDPDGLTSSATTASAYGDASGLHADATASITALVKGSGPFAAQAQGESKLLDFITFSGTHPVDGYVTLMVTTHGASSGGFSDGLTQLDILNGSGPNFECFFFEAGNCAVHDLINFNTGLSLSLLLAANAVAQIGTGGTKFGAGTMDSGFAHFLDTAYISGISFTDVNNNPLTLSFAAESGLTYPMPQPKGIPEPATLALLGIGFAGFAASRRRRLN